MCMEACMCVLCVCCMCVTTYIHTTYVYVWEEGKYSCIHGWEEREIYVHERKGLGSEGNIMSSLTNMFPYMYHTHMGGKGLGRKGNITSSLTNMFRYMYHTYMGGKGLGREVNVCINVWYTCIRMYMYVCMHEYVHIRYTYTSASERREIWHPRPWVV